MGEICKWRRHRRRLSWPGKQTQLKWIFLHFIGQNILNVVFVFGRMKVEATQQMVESRMSFERGEWEMVWCYQMDINYWQTHTFFSVFCRCHQQQKHFNETSSYSCENFKLFFVDFPLWNINTHSRRIHKCILCLNLKWMKLTSAANVSLSFSRLFLWMKKKVRKGSATIVHHAQLNWIQRVLTRVYRQRKTNLFP